MVLLLIKFICSTLLFCILFLHTCDAVASVQDVAALAASSKKAGDAKSSHVLDFMLDEPGGTADEDLPAGPKRCSVTFLTVCE